MKRPPVIVVQLIHIVGPLKGEIQDFSEDVISIGRHPSSLLRFPPDLTIVSRKHAEILRDGTRFKLVDHSANGTLVNGKRVQEVYLKNGDVIEFGDGGPKASFLTQIKECPVEPAAQPAPPPHRNEMPVHQEAVPRPEARERQEEAGAEKAQVPLAIQYGPTLRCFKTLPITIGTNPQCDLVLEHPAILDRHAQIFFSQDQYWAKDLTGQGSVQVDGKPIVLQSPLQPNSILSLSPRGPVFRFIGEGRLVEAAEPGAEETSPPPEKGPETPPEAVEPKPSKGLRGILKKIFER